MIDQSVIIAEAQGILLFIALNQLPQSLVIIAVRPDIFPDFVLRGDSDTKING